MNRVLNVRLDQFPKDLDDWFDEDSPQGKKSHLNHQPKPITKFENNKNWQETYENDPTSHKKKKSCFRDIDDKLNLRRLKREIYDKTQINFK